LPTLNVFRPIEGLVREAPIGLVTKDRPSGEPAVAQLRIDKKILSDLEELVTDFVLVFQRVVLLGRQLEGQVDPRLLIFSFLERKIGVLLELESILLVERAQAVNYCALSAVVGADYQRV